MTTEATTHLDARFYQFTVENQVLDHDAQKRRRGEAQSLGIVLLAPGRIVDLLLADGDQRHAQTVRVVAVLQTPLDFKVTYELQVVDVLSTPWPADNDVDVVLLFAGGDDLRLAWLQLAAFLR